jgi:hypothetical protein
LMLLLLHREICWHTILVLSLLVRFRITSCSSIDVTPRGSLMLKLDLCSWIQSTLLIVYVLRGSQHSTWASWYTPDRSTYHRCTLAWMSVFVIWVHRSGFWGYQGANFLWLHLLLMSIKILALNEIVKEAYIRLMLEEIVVELLL